MASAELPAVLKPLKPYIQRGKELIKGNANPVVAFHCFKWAVELGIKLNDKTPECRQFLGDLMTELENTRSCTAGKTPEELQSICEKFAENIFNNADSADKNGAATKATAQSYYAAAIFYEILAQFYPDKELPEDLKMAVKYAKYRATKILAAVREGRPVTPPGSMDQTESEEGGSSELPPAAPAVPVSPVIPVAQAALPSPVVNQPPPQYSPQAQAQPFHGRGSVGRPVTSISKAKKADCAELIRFAKAALDADDIPATIERLQNVLALLHE